MPVPETPESIARKAEARRGNLQRLAGTDKAGKGRKKKATAKKKKQPAAPKGPRATNKQKADPSGTMKSRTKAALRSMKKRGKLGKGAKALAQREGLGDFYNQLFNEK